MNFVDYLNIFGVEAKQIPSITGSGAPTTATEGAAGCLYMDTDTGELYKCTAAAADNYTWQPLGSGTFSLEEIVDAVLDALPNGDEVSY